MVSSSVSQIYIRFKDFQMNSITDTTEKSTIALRCQCIFLFSPYVNEYPCPQLQNYQEMKVPFPPTGTQWFVKYVDTEHFVESILTEPFITREVTTFFVLLRDKKLFYAA